jgi:hypothetical protein
MSKQTQELKARWEARVAAQYEGDKLPDLLAMQKEIRDALVIQGKKEAARPDVRQLSLFGPCSNTGVTHD